MLSGAFLIVNHPRICRPLQHLLWVSGSFILAFDSRMKIISSSSLEQLHLGSPPRSALQAPRAPATVGWATARGSTRSPDEPSTHGPLPNKILVDHTIKSFTGCHYQDNSGIICSTVVCIYIIYICEVLMLNKLCQSLRRTRVSLGL